MGYLRKIPYDTLSLTLVQNAKRYNTETAVEYDIDNHYPVPTPDSFFPLPENKRKLLTYLCENWSALNFLPDLGTKSLILAGGFASIDTTVMVHNGQASPIIELESTQTEADTRLILHAIYSAQKKNVERIVFMCSDTNVVENAIYYGSTLLKDARELWINSGPETFQPIHDIVSSLGPLKCRVLAFLHSISGRDTTNYSYNT